MSVESDLFDTLCPLVGVDDIAGVPEGRPRVFPDVAPASAGRPYVTFQQVGGGALNFLSGLPDKRSGRFQINTWAATRLEAMSLIRRVEDAVRVSSALHATTLGGAVAIYEQDTKLYGARQDFAITFQA